MLNCDRPFRAALNPASCFPTAPQGHNNGARGNAPSVMKAVHISVVAMIAALSGLGIAIATKNSEALGTSILALVTAFLPAVQLALPWFATAPAQGEMPKFEGIPKP